MHLEDYQHLAQSLTEGPVVLATVIESTGSVPREVGAKMGIAAQGRIFGTIGGGAAEARVIEQAMGVLESGEPQWVELDLTGAPQRETQGICGGIMRVWIAYWSGEAAIALVQNILSMLRSGQSSTLITPLLVEKFPYLLPEITEEILESALIEILHPPPLLLIVGAGHCGIQLAKVAHWIGFQIAVQDERPEWANAHHYPQAIWISTAALTSTIDRFANHPQLYVALLTRSYQYDIEALTALLQRDLPYPYIGMMGSKKRVQQVLNAIANPDKPQSQLPTIHAPIGLDIGALTPKEIAISICAELIQVKRIATAHPILSLPNNRTS
jgi:xanthine dehydrogenase accessory factor